MCVASFSGGEFNLNQEFSAASLDSTQDEVWSYHGRKK